MHGLDDGDAEMLERAGTALAVPVAGGAAVCLVGWMLAGCTPRAQTAAEVAAYGAELRSVRGAVEHMPGLRGLPPAGRRALRAGLLGAVRPVTAILFSCSRRLRASWSYLRERHRGRA